MADPSGESTNEVQRAGRGCLGVTISQQVRDRDTHYDEEARSLGWRLHVLLGRTRSACDSSQNEIVEKVSDCDQRASVLERMKETDQIWRMEPPSCV
jgi:hypothetical protein